MLLIPSIDLRAGRCVRLRQGDFAMESAYSIEPAKLADRYCRLGAPWLHVVGTAAIERPDEVAAWLDQFGAERICIALDVRMGADGAAHVRTDGWTRSSTSTLARALSAFPRELLRHVLCTDIERDGTLRGPNLRLYRECCAQFPEFSWQASGGIRNHHDLGLLRRIGVAVAVSGTALLEERIAPRELRPFLPAESSPA